MLIFDGVTNRHMQSNTRYVVYSGQKEDFLYQFCVHQRIGDK